MRCCLMCFFLLATFCFADWLRPYSLTHLPPSHLATLCCLALDSGDKGDTVNALESICRGRGGAVRWQRGFLLLGYENGFEKGGTTGLTGKVRSNFAAEPRRQEDAGTGDLHHQHRPAPGSWFRADGRECRFRSAVSIRPVRANVRLNRHNNARKVKLVLRIASGMWRVRAGVGPPSSGPKNRRTNRLPVPLPNRR